MIGFVLLIVAIYTFFDGRYRYISYFLYISFMLGYGGGGLGLWTDQISGVKNLDCAVAYTFIINVYYIITKQWTLPKGIFVYLYLVFLCFLVFSSIFSFVYYNLSPTQIIQGGRHFILLLSLPILYKCSKQEFKKIVELLLYVCIFEGILYIPQVILGTNLLPYAGEVETDDATGLYRYYNFPENLALFLCLSFSTSSLFKVKNTNYLKILFLIVLACTLGRSLIILNIFTLFLYILLNSNTGRYKNQLVVLVILITPLFFFLSSRFSEGGTENDLDTILEGGFAEDFQSESSSTMTYRLAWAFERGYYLSERPLGEQIFGMGMVSESQDWVNNKYDFMIGLTDESDQVAQLRTPDIAYGNMITQMGFGGSILYMIFTATLAAFFWKKRKKSPYFAYYAVSITLVFILGFAGSTFSEPQYFAMPFLMTSLVNEEEKAKEEKKKKLKALLVLLLMKKRRENQIAAQA